MANLDSRDKRGSALAWNLGWGRVFPNPDGSIASQGDRQQIGLVYRGILAGGLIVAQFVGSVRRLTGYGT